MMITQLNAHSIAEIIREVDAKLLPKMTLDDLWCHIAGYTVNEDLMNYIYDELKMEVKQE